MALPAPVDEQMDPQLVRAMQEMEERVTTTVDTSAWAGRKQAALAAHASQLDGWGLLRLPTDTFADVFGSESFIRSAQPTSELGLEEDLFAGLR